MPELNSHVLIELSNRYLDMFGYPTHVLQRFAGYTRTSSGCHFYAFIANPDTNEDWYEVCDEDGDFAEELLVERVLISSKPCSDAHDRQSSWWIDESAVLWVPVECCHLFRPTVQRMAMAKCRESLRAVSTYQTAQA